MRSPSRAPARASGRLRVVLTTYPSEEVAEREIASVLSARLAACANSVPIASAYWWKGAVERARETLVLFKTRPNEVAALFRFLKDRHPYSVPEIAEIGVSRVESGYLRYLAETLGPVDRPRNVRARRGGRRARGARAPARTRARPPRP